MFTRTDILMLGGYAQMMIGYLRGDSTLLIFGLIAFTIGYWRAK